MRILWVKPGKLLPVDTGGKLRTYNILRHLSTKHEVVYLSYHDGQHDVAYEREIAAHLPGAQAIPARDTETGRLRSYLNYAHRLHVRTPYSVNRFTSPRVQRIVADLISQRRFDIAVCDFLASTLNFPSTLNIPTVLFQHNVESLLWKRRAEFETKLPDRIAAKIEYAKMKRFEPIQVRRFHRVLAVSEQDQAAMSSMADSTRISVIPTGVDLRDYRYDPAARARSALVVFTGSMDWAPNIDGVEYFCQDIWPHIFRQVPKARFRIVGREPAVRVRKLASSSVEITGTVPSIIDHLREASVLVVPLRIGGGTRIKIYEGMAMGKATVSTRVGAEGLDVRSGSDILLADDPKQFAEHVVELLLDESTRYRYEAAAAATAQRYDWSVVAERFAEVLEMTIRSVSASTVAAPSTKSLCA